MAAVVRLIFVFPIIVEGSCKILEEELIGGGDKKKEVMSMHSFYTHGSTFLHVVTIMHFGDLQHHSDSFNTFTFSNYEMSCTHVHHL